jgi:hypothetical protein
MLANFHIGMRVSSTLPAFSGSGMAEPGKLLSFLITGEPVGFSKLPSDITLQAPSVGVLVSTGTWGLVYPEQAMASYCVEWDD